MNANKEKSVEALERNLKSANRRNDELIRDNEQRNKEFNKREELLLDIIMESRKRIRIGEPALE